MFYDWLLLPIGGCKSETCFTWPVAAGRGVSDKRQERGYRLLHSSGHAVAPAGEAALLADLWTLTIQQFSVYWKDLSNTIQQLQSKPLLEDASMLSWCSKLSNSCERFEQWILRSLCFPINVLLCAQRGALARFRGSTIGTTYMVYTCSGLGHPASDGGSFGWGQMVRSWL